MHGEVVLVLAHVVVRELLQLLDLLGVGLDLVLLHLDELVLVQRVEVELLP